MGVSSLREKMESLVSGSEFPGMLRFAVQLEKLLSCVESAVAAGDRDQAAWAFYQSTARQWLFYLQALCRIYKKVGSKKRFKALGETVKELEDRLGAIDYWDAWVKLCEPVKELPPAMLETMLQHRSDEVAALQQVLENGAWLDKDCPALGVILEELEAEDWEKPGKDREKIAEFLCEELEEIEQKYSAGEFDFAQLEDGVHEFRRQLRWISIYGHALHGLLQTDAEVKPEAFHEKYMTESVLKSPFNELPPAPAKGKVLEVQLGDFYALSWLISQIGKIKDQGQKIEALHHVAEESGVVQDAALEKCFAAMIPAAEQTMQEIPALVAPMVETFLVEERILSRMRQTLAACV
jgi:hypothetical protein